MKIAKVSVGGWFQRTTLHLSEIYDFLREGVSRLDLDNKKLFKYHKKLELKDVTYEIDGLEYLNVTTNEDVYIKIFEDGLIVLSYQFTRGFSSPILI